MQKSTQEDQPIRLWWTSDVSFDQLQKYWNGLPPKGRQDVLKVDKKTLLKQARENMVCSECCGYLVEEFYEIIMYRRSSQQDGAVDQDPSIDPWCCLTITRDGTQSLTLLDRYFMSTCLKGIQEVFDNALARERERKLLYPYSCGLGGRRWKQLGAKKSCAVLTAPLPHENLAEFWSSQGEESRQYLFKMTEEDFIEQLTSRFDDKKLCKYCRKNVVRQFRELKEQTITQKESGFHYEISHDTVQADWSQTFIHTSGSHSHFEWGIGTAKGKSDISAFKNVGLSKIVQVNGLDLSGLDACYITLRAWKTDGDCTELSVEARTSMGQQYVHCSLAVGNGFVTVTEGESIQNFFKHAEELANEDNNLVDVNGNTLDGSCSHPQRNARTPELARKFLLDAATVFFRDQVENALMKKRLRQNAHSIFVSLALKMLEERAHVSCKEHLRLEKQMKLLEEEAKEKNEEEERKERRKNKEREKKLRRKERTKEKEKRGETSSLTKQHLAPQINIEESTVVDEETDATETVKITSSRPVSPHIQAEQEIDDYMRNNMHDSSDARPDENFASSNSKNCSSGSDQLKFSGWKLKNGYRKETTSKCSINKQFAVVPRTAKSTTRAGDLSKINSGRNIPSSRDSPRRKAVREPTELQKKNAQSHLESDVAVRSTLSGHAMEPYKPLETPGALSNNVGGQKTVVIKDKDDIKKELKSRKQGLSNNGHSRFHLNKETCQYSKEVVRATSRSDSFSSCLSKGNNSGPSSTPPVIEPLPTLNSEYASQQSDGIEASRRQHTRVPKCEEVVMDKRQIANGVEPITSCLLVGSRIHTPAKVSKENDNGHPDVCHLYLQAQDIPEKQEPMQKQPNAAAGEENQYSDISQAENNGFSLFHFGSPFDLANAAAGKEKLNSDISQAEDNGFSLFHFGSPFALANAVAGEEKLNSDISRAEDNSFSLFHFGSPFALANAYKSDSLRSDDSVGGQSLVKFIHHDEGNLTSNDRDSFEEYNLFSTKKGKTFSIFSK